LYLEESLEAIVKTTMGAVQATGAALVLEDGRIAWPEGKPGAYAVRTPLRWKRREIGQLVADRDRPFTDEERALLEAIAHHAAVFSELLQNALEHGAGTVRIELARRDGDVVLAIDDEGAGAAGAPSGTGLSIVRALVADELQGSFACTGARTEVVFPA